ncbi:MAG: hypothetical protein JWO98_3325 [Frankiales bacterium]|nr:hypothetical protein [Frankiales bacterium]
MVLPLGSDFGGWPFRRAGLAGLLFRRIAGADRYDRSVSVTDVVTASGSGVAALAAVVLAGVTVRLARSGRAQLEAERMDSRAPTVVLALREPDWPPYEPSQAYGHAPQPLVGSSGLYKIPAHGVQRRIMLVAKGELRNIGASPAEVIIGDGGRFLLGHPDDEDALVAPELGTDMSRRQRRRLNPGESAWAVFIDERSSGEWREHALATPDGVMAGREVTVTCTDIFDRGVTDTFTVKVCGRPLMGSGEDLGAWRLGDRHLTEGISQLVAAEVTPIVRSYWASRTSNRRIPEVPT